MFKLYNSLTKKEEEFAPLNPPIVTLYTCGPTVYDYPHIGHGRKYVNDDILKRTLTLFGFQVKHVMNITDVGHLVSDSDEGEDKLEKGAKKTGKTVWEVAKFYEEVFHEDMAKLNIIPPTVVPRATDNIPEQIELIKKLFENGYAYDTPEAVYFDVTKFKDYGKLFGQSLEEKEVAVRADVKTGEHKKHPADFSLWFKRVGRFADHQMHWDSPWGDGFPGWHIECSAMSMKYLGETIDIHTGGIDHLPIHHPNEIAQSEGATGKQFVRFWMHYNFLNIKGEKMSKSRENFYRIADIVEKGFEPLDLRYFFLTSHYRKELNFTWEALEAARTARIRLVDVVVQLAGQKNADSRRTTLSQEKMGKVDDYQKRFTEALENDLNMPQALAVVWETIKSNIPSEDKYDLVMGFNQVLGLDLANSLSAQAGKPQIANSEIPDEIQKLVDKRNQLRGEKKWGEADVVRKEIEEKGWLVEDTAVGSKVVKKS